MKNILIFILLVFVFCSCKKDTEHQKSDLNEIITYTIYGKTDSSGIDSIYQYAVYIPNAFTPNDDGANEGWGVKAYGVTNFELYIYDMWGKVVFTTKNMNELWNGYRNNDKTGNVEPSGVYECDIKVQDVTGESHQYYEKIMLIL